MARLDHYTSCLPCSLKRGTELCGLQTTYNYLPVLRSIALLDSLGSLRKDTHFLFILHHSKPIREWFHYLPVSPAVLPVSYWDLDSCNGLLHCPWSAAFLPDLTPFSFLSLHCLHPWPMYYICTNPMTCKTQTVYYSPLSSQPSGKQDLNPPCWIYSNLKTGVWIPVVSILENVTSWLSSP